MPESVFFINAHKNNVLLTKKRIRYANISVGVVGFEMGFCGFWLCISFRE